MSPIFLIFCKVFFFFFTNALFRWWCWNLEWMLVKQLLLFLLAGNKESDERTNDQNDVSVYLAGQLDGWTQLGLDLLILLFWFFYRNMFCVLSSSFFSSLLITSTKKTWGKNHAPRHTQNVDVDWLTELFKSDRVRKRKERRGERGGTERKEERKKERGERKKERDDRRRKERRKKSTFFARAPSMTSFCKTHYSLTRSFVRCEKNFFGRTKIKTHKKRFFFRFDSDRYRDWLMWCYFSFSFFVRSSKKILAFASRKKKDEEAIIIRSLARWKEGNLCQIFFLFFSLFSILAGGHSLFLRLFFFESYL